MTATKLIINGEEHSIGGSGENRDIKNRDIIAILHSEDFYHYDYDSIDGYDLKIKIGKFRTVDGESITQLEKGDIVSIIEMDGGTSRALEKKGGGAKIAPHGIDNRISIYADNADPETDNPIQVIYLAPFWRLFGMSTEMREEYDDSDLTTWMNATIQTGEIREGRDPITNDKCLVYMMWNAGRTFVGPLQVSE